MIISQFINLRKKKRIRADFTEPYNSLPRNRQPEFRHSVMASQNWEARQTFYDAISGRKALPRKAYNEIVDIFKKFNITINQ